MHFDHNIFTFRVILYYFSHFITFITFYVPNYSLSLLINFKPYLRSQCDPILLIINITADTPIIC